MRLSSHTRQFTPASMISPPLIYRPLQGLSHEMDLAFEDMHGQFKA